MRYFSTRSGKPDKSFTEVVMTGMAEDGGLFLPEVFPDFSGRLPELKGLSYSELAFEVMKPFAGDISEADLQDIVKRSYATFNTPEVVPVKKLSSCYLAELFCGPTFAFKDVALQFLGNLFEYILEKKGGRLNIIGATSGDTGSAAIYGVKGRKHIKIVILFPEGRVSGVQKLQMTTVADSNVNTLEVAGTFDDCQSIVKTLFADLEFKQKYTLGAVNSINWARILAQIVYYFYCFLRLDEKEVNFVVPTGNFGNIFAGWCARAMGLPIEKLILATNSNDILHRFVARGDYSTRTVIPTASPAMDIQLASNFERYLYYLLGRDALKLTSAMQELKKTGKIVFEVETLLKVEKEFLSCGVNDEMIKKTIRSVYEKDAYIADPHTACGIYATQHLGLPAERTIVLSTAHPAKFPDVVEETLDVKPVEPDALARVHTLPSRTSSVSASVAEVKKLLEQLFA